MLKLIFLMTALIFCFHTSEARVMAVSYQDSGQTLTDIYLQSSHILLVRKTGDVSSYREEVLPLQKDQDLTTYKVLKVFKSHTVKEDDNITVLKAPEYVPDGSGANPIILEYQPSYPLQDGEDVVLFLQDREPDKMIYTYFAAEGRGIIPDVVEMRNLQRSLPMQRP